VTVVPGASRRAVHNGSRTAEKEGMASYSASIDLPPTVASVPLARRLAREVLRTWQAPQDHGDAELLVTELVANVVDHVGGHVLTLELTLAGAWLRIAVVDGSAVRPVVREMSHEQERGRGMRMVAAIADRWGAEDHDGGKRVWFELAPAAAGEPERSGWFAASA
jgi:anti-sigma regulatory factor (Ser/Thr protein kinase)